MEWKRIKQLKNKNSIEDFQNEYKLDLPLSLKNLILKYNGARPEKKLIKMDNGHLLEMKMLLSYNREDLENIYDCINFFKDKYNNDRLPFAIEPSGNYFCINLENFSIEYWNYENDTLITVANSLKQFLDKLF